MSKLLDALFGCPHKRCTFPITAKSGQSNSNPAKSTATYIVCLECGKEFTYDWQRMKVVRSKMQAA
jgi:predicted transcriptional regulator